MSMTSAPASEPSPTAEHFRSYSRTVLRIVEAQYKISTDRLTDGPAEQDVLETLVEEVKPSMPAEAASLHHLLATPFRYGYSKSTRFRRASERPGIFYASENEKTAVAEAAYYKLRFFAAAPGAELPSTTTEYYVFSVPLEVTRCLDLTAEPLNVGRPFWTLDQDYKPCQRLAAKARDLGCQLIRYESVRETEKAANIALLDPSAFQRPVPKVERSWHFRFHDEKLTTLAAGPSNARFDFTFTQFGLTKP